MSKSNWSSIKLYFSGDEYFDDAIRDIENAESEILVEVYIFEYDALGRRLVEALDKAHRRGVSVRVLVDGVGCMNSLPDLQKAFAQRDLRLRVFQPLPLHHKYYFSFSRRAFWRLFISLKNANKRNHRKVICIDGRKAYLGSFNISHVHSKRLMGARAWRDTGVALEGEGLGKLHRAFFQLWRKSKWQISLTRTLFFKKMRFHQEVFEGIRLNTSLRWRYSLLRDLNKRMKEARTRIFVTNAYFIPRKSVLASLRRAARRGVHVALCLPAKTDVPIVRWASRSLYSRLLKDGVQIFEYQPTVLHAKTLIIDSWATVGSHNLNHRSLTHDLEVEAVFHQPEVVGRLLEKWEEDIRLSRPISMEDLGKWGWFEKILGQLAYWFRYWM